MLLNVYRPPKHSADFFDDFNDLMSLTCTDHDCFIAVGDFNIHVDNSQDKGTKKLCHTLDNFELTQHVTQSTHNKEKILDLVISKGINISRIVVTDVATSKLTKKVYHG